MERYAAHLPITSATPRITLGEGATPLVRAPALEERTGLAEVWLKVEGQNPTGSFKDRGMVVAVAKALEEGARTILCASTGNIAAYWKGFREAVGARMATRRPRMWGFQAAGAAPIVVGRRIERPETIATAIRIGNPASWQGATTARDESGGVIEIVTDEEILAAYGLLASRVGIFCEPASAASVAGVLKRAAEGALGDARRVVCVLTGSGPKDPDTAKRLSRPAERVPADLAAVRERIVALAVA